MKLIIPSILFAISQANRLLQESGCATIKCAAGPCFDNHGTPRCCPEDDICSSSDYYTDTKVICADGNQYANKCYGYCAGNQPDTCKPKPPNKPICKCDPGENDCPYGYECIETPIGFGGCAQDIGNSCYGFCVSKGKSCGGFAGISLCEADEQCFYTTIFSDGRGIGYCGTLPNKCKDKPVGCNEDTKFCPDGSTVSRVPPNCEFEPCPTEEPTYCGGFDNCQVFFDGCNECDCGHDGFGWPLRCGEKQCNIYAFGKPYCVECIEDTVTCPDGSVVVRDTANNCEFEPCPFPGETCANINCEKKCYDTPNGPICCDPFERRECREGPMCGGITGIQCKPDFKCVNDPNAPCTFGKDPDCSGICLLVRKTCEDVQCKGIDICYEFMNGAECCDPDICGSNKKCGGPTNAPCKEFGYECVPNPFSPCDMETDINCAGVCVNLFAEPGCKDDLYECADGMLVSRDPDNNCEFKPCPLPPIPCPFENCETYNNGCNDCQCGKNGMQICTTSFCPPGAPPLKARCIDCKYGYELNEYGHCVKISDNRCPLDKPSPYDSCNFKGTCYWGKESCCGKTFDSIGCECHNGKVMCFFTDSCLGAPAKCGTTEEPIMCVQDVYTCPDGSDVGRDPLNDCKFKPCPLLPPPKPCGGFKNCEVYNNGCNTCQCGENGLDGCNIMLCPPEIVRKPECIRCKYGYVLNEYGECIIDNKPEPEICCDPKDRPGANGGPICSDGSSCCPNGKWTCGIGNGGFPCDGEILFPFQDEFGKICAEDNENTFPSGCANILCRGDAICCDDGFGKATCCSNIVIQPNDDKVKCTGYDTDSCVYEKGYVCRPDPECVAKGGSFFKCTGKKVCLSRGGKCDSDIDCQDGYHCVSVTDKTGFCIKYQKGKMVVNEN